MSCGMAVLGSLWGLAQRVRVAPEPVPRSARVAPPAPLARPTLPATAPRFGPDPIQWTVSLRGPRFVIRSLSARTRRRVWARWETAVWAVFHGVHALFVGATLERRWTDLAQR